MRRVEALIGDEDGEAFSGDVITSLTDGGGE